MTPSSSWIRGKILGLGSLLLSGAFWAYAESSFGPNRFTSSVYTAFLLLPGILVLAALLAIAAAVKGSKWWLLALLAPSAGGLLLLTAGV
jgi:hypothetical protein